MRHPATKEFDQLSADVLGEDIMGALMLATAYQVVPTRPIPREVFESSTVRDLFVEFAASYSEISSDYAEQKITLVQAKDGLEHLRGRLITALSRHPNPAYQTREYLRSLREHVASIDPDQEPGSQRSR